MSFGFLNLLMLLGLAGVSIPPLIHLLNRRRFQVVDWGAMQFLQISETTRRRLLIEEVLLMLLRMGLIAVMVLGLAAPYTVSPLLARLGSRSNRDVVLVFDGSYSMGYTGTGQPAHQLAQEWATAFIGELSAGDSVMLLQAKQQVVPVLPEPTSDLEAVRKALGRLTSPAGGSDWPQAVKTAADLLIQKSQRPEREIILLTDGQRFGWADDSCLLRWELLAQQVKNESAVKPRIWVVNVAPGRPAEPPNWSLAPLRASRAIASAGQTVTFKTALVLQGQEEYQPPYRLRLEIDGKPAEDLRPPASAPLVKGQVPITFTQRFAEPGSHLVSVIVEPDPPPEQQPAGYRIKDHLPGDNRQDFALEVVKALPVLLVDGDARPGVKRRGTDFLRDALSPARDLTPVVQSRVVPIQEFTAAVLAGDGPGGPNPPPNVVILADVPRLTPEQREALDRFLADGGGVLVTLGERVDAAFWNEHLYRGGQGWLPARLDEVRGDETRPDQAANPLPSSFFHPALDLFRDVTSGGLADARFPRWWKVSTPDRHANAVPVALLANNDPLLVERPYRGGRVMVCAVPLDNSWRTNLPDLLAFAPLTHELVYYLAGARAADHNLQPGQPIRYRPAGEVPPGHVILHPPEGDDQVLTTSRWPLIYENTRETGVYRLEAADERVAWFAVQPDHRESILAPCDDADREKVQKLLPLTYEDDRSRMTTQLQVSDQRQELWWWFLVGVVLLLASEVWLTRRIAMNR